MAIATASSRRFYRKALISSILAVSIFSALAIGPAWFGAVVSERTLRLGFVKVLESVRVAFVAGALAASLGAVGLGAFAIRDRRRSARRPIVARVWLLCVSTLLGLAVLEISAALWRNRRHATPVLPRNAAPPRRREPKLSSDPRSNPDEFRIVVLGGSSAFGVPYDSRFSIGSIVAWGLRPLLPAGRIALDVLAEPGIHLERNHEKLAELARRPDLLIVHVGDNELSYRYPWDRTVPGYYRDGPSRTVFAEATGRFSSFCALIDEAIFAQRRGEVPPPKPNRPLVDRPICSAEEFAAISADFRRRLDAIVSWADSIGCKVVLVVPPTNDADFEPNRSVLPPDTETAEREAFAREFEIARGLETTDPSKSISLYENLIRKYPDFAEIRYRLGRLLRDAGRTSEARAEFVRARDRDGFPIRCLSEFQATIRDVGARHGSIVIDAPALFRAHARQGLPGLDLFHDAMHPTLRGQALLGDEIVQELKKSRFFRPSDRGAVPDINAETCAKRFGLDDPRAWLPVCVAERAFYKTIAGLRFDPKQRLARSARYAKAVRLIESGGRPEDAKIPGVGVLANRALDEPSSNANRDRP